MKNFLLCKEGHEPRIVPSFLIIAVLAGMTSGVETAVRVVDLLLLGVMSEVDIVTRDQNKITVKLA